MRARNAEFLHLCAEHRFVGAHNGAKAMEKATAAAAKDPAAGEAVVVRVDAEHSSATAKEMKADAFHGLRQVVHLLLDAPVMHIMNMLWDV